MATTKRLVEAHGGSIVVQSKPNVGTQVTVRLPLAERATEPPSRRSPIEVGSAAP
jgi:signal transduction histidine kinase